MAHRILHDITSNLHQAKLYSIMEDETTDASNKTQLVFIRWVDTDFKVHEEFMGLAISA